MCTLLMKLNLIKTWELFLELRQKKDYLKNKENIKDASLALKKCKKIDSKV